MHVTFLGVRGSIPAPGPSFVRYGGHTSCIAISGSREGDPVLVLDAGTGIQSMSARLGGRPFHGSILLSHLHWDHVQGIPFFVAADRDDARATVYLPAQDGKTGAELLASSMAPPAFPITPQGLKGDWKFEAIESGILTIEGFTVTAADVRHKGGRTFGYRVADENVSIAYLPDHVAKGDVTAGLRQIGSDVDVLLHDAQFTEPERVLADAYGHSTIDDAVQLAEDLQVGRLVLIHHSPSRSDEALDAIAAGLSTSMPVTVAAEGQELEITQS